MKKANEKTDETALERAATVFGGNISDARHVIIPKPSSGDIGIKLKVARAAFEKIKNIPLKEAPFPKAMQKTHAAALNTAPAALTAASVKNEVSEKSYFSDREKISPLFLTLLTLKSFAVRICPDS